MADEGPDPSERQLEVARLVSDGLTDKKIAAALGISEETVAYHVSRLTKLWTLEPSLNIRVQIVKRYLTIPAKKAS